MTNEQAKQAFIHQVPICWFDPRAGKGGAGIKYKRISSILWRITQDGEFIMQMELVPMVGRTIIVAAVKDVEII